MKIKIARFIALAAIIGLTFTACGGGGLSKKDFIGTWIAGGYSCTISDKEIILELDTSQDKFRIDSVIPMENTNVKTKDNYPRGIRFTCTLTATTGYDQPGRTEEINYYMHPSKKEFVNIYNAVFKKQ